MGEIVCTKSLNQKKKRKNKSMLEMEIDMDQVAKKMHKRLASKQIV